MDVRAYDVYLAAFCQHTACYLPEVEVLVMLEPFAEAAILFRRLTADY